MYSAKGRALRSLLAHRGQVLLGLDPQGRADLDVIRHTRAAAPLLMQDAAALMIQAWVRSALKLGGELAEAGVFMGGSARLICEAKGQAPLHLFDVFETLQDLSPHRCEEQAVLDHFGSTHARLEQVRSLLSPYPQVHFYPGLLSAMAGHVADRQFCFVHLDLDLGQATAEALAFFYPRLLRGGVMIGDDYNLAPVQEAFAGFFAGRRDVVTLLPWGQVVVVKAQGPEPSSRL
jgi:O-methyltransferase